MYFYIGIASLASDSFCRIHTMESCVCAVVPGTAKCRCPVPSPELFVSVPRFEQTLKHTGFPSASIHRVKIHREGLTLSSLKGVSTQLPGPCVFPQVGSPFWGNPLGHMWGYPHVTIHSTDLGT